MLMSYSPEWPDSAEQSVAETASMRSVVSQDQNSDETNHCNYPSEDDSSKGKAVMKHNLTDLSDTGPEKETT